MFRSIIVMAGLLLSTAAEASWYVAETDNFLVYAEGREAETREFASRLERYARAMRFMQNMPTSSGKAKNRLTIYRYGDREDIAELYGDRRSSIAGFFIPRSSGSVAFVPARDTSFRGSPGTRPDWDAELDAETILFHEYAHHFMMQHFPAAYPAWYIEGFAELYGTTQIAEDGIFRIGEPANHRGMQLFHDSYFPVKKLFEPKLKDEDTRHYYSMGWLLTHYLTFSPERAGQLKKYLTAVNQGVPSAEAASSSFGDLGKLDEELQRYKRSRLMAVEVKPNNYVPPEVKVRRLTDPEEASITVRIRSQRGVDEKSAPRVAAEARTVAGSHPHDAFVQVALAEAELDAGNLEAAEAAADRALAADPEAASALIYKGMVHLKRARKDPSQFAAARQWFVKANRLNPNDPQALILNYLTFDQAGGEVPELAIIGLERAFELAPFDPEVRFLLARQLLREGRSKPARTVLSPVAFSAHRGKAKDAAAKIIESIDGSDLATAVSLADEQVSGKDEEEGKDGKSR